MRSRWELLLFAAGIAVLLFILKALDFHYMVRDVGMEIYLAVIAAVFLAAGIWLGTRKKEHHPALVPAPKEMAGEELSVTSGAIGVPLSPLTARELEVLQLMAEGLSNQEIAERLFVSLNTVKTHSANLFVKLDVKRRTQAIIKGKEMNLIPR